VSAGQVAAAVICGAVLLLVVAGLVWQAATAIRARLAGDDAGADPVDAHAETAIALLCPDDWSCPCTGCSGVDPFDGLVADLEQWADAVARRWTHPDPPISPGRG
jgi:hypothetical protein